MSFIKSYKRYIFLFLILYTIIHFIHGGIYQPLIINKTKFTQINEESLPLYEFLYNNKTIELTNPRQYGPVFFFIMLPFMSIFNEKSYMSIILFIVAQITMLFSFYIIYNLLFRNIKGGLFYLFLIWFNFNPLYYNMGTKAPEFWEILFISIALYFIIDKREYISGTTITLATLIKILPVVYFYYFLLRKWNAFFWGTLSMIIMLSISWFVFGYNMGLYYLYFIITRPLGQVTFVQAFYENITIKATITKIFAGFKMKYTLEEVMSRELGLFEGYSFVFNEHNAFLINTIYTLILICGLLFFAWVCFKLNQNKKSELILFGLISITMILFSPHSSWEYTVLLLPAFAIALYFLITDKLNTILKSLFCLSYIFLGVPIPMKIFVHLLPLNYLNNIFCNNIFDLSESYKAYGFPTIGLIAIYLFFIILALKNIKSQKISKK